MELEEQFTGCLLGLAVGDALGAPAEFMTREAIQRTFGHLRDMVGGGWLELKPGQATDDTQMMVCLAESLVAKNAFDADDMAQRFASWYRRGPRDIGHTTKTALAKIASGVPWQEASQVAHRELKGRSASNGGLMRCAPLGLFHWREPDSILQDSATSCRITHWDPRAAYASSALNLIIAGCLDGLSLRQAIEKAIVRIEPYQHEVARALDECLTGPYDKPEVSGLAVDTLHAACRCLYQSASFENALEEAVNLGGDTDTVGAVCGAMAGAYYGKGAIPARWLKVLESRDYIEGLAKALYQRSVDQQQGEVERVHGRESFL